MLFSFRRVSIMDLQADHAWEVYKVVNLVHLHIILGQKYEFIMDKTMHYQVYAFR